MSGEAGALTARGDRVEVRPPTREDVEAYVDAVTRSSRRLSQFAVPDPHNLPAVIENQGRTYRTFMVHALDRAGDHGLVGRVNVANIVGGAFRSATVGYDAYDPYVGQGLFAEGLGLVLDIAFAAPPDGLGLHRIEANIQPANTRSAGLVRSLGFLHEGFSEDFLDLPGADGRRAWRDHDRYTILASDWPAAPYRAHRGRRLAAVVTDAVAGDESGLARRLAEELHLPLFSSRTVADHAVLWELLFDSPAGGVVEGRFSAPEVRMGLARARFTPAVVPVIEDRRDLSRREVVELALSVRAAYA